MQCETIPVTRFEQNCSIVWCEHTHRAAVIDPGGDVALIEDLLEWQELSLEAILVTHGHPDHAGGVAQLAARSGARIEGPHRLDEHTIARLPDIGQRYGLATQAFTPQRWLNDGDRVQVGDSFIDVLHCPGHTRGHVAYFDAVGRRAFVGDILFRHTIGAWEHADGDLATLVRSIRLKLFPLGDDVCFVPGHGETSTFGHEREANPFVSDAAWEKLPARIREP